MPAAVVHHLPDHAHAAGAQAAQESVPTQMGAGTQAAEHHQPAAARIWVLRHDPHSSTGRGAGRGWAGCARRADAVRSAAAPSGPTAAGRRLVGRRQTARAGIERAGPLDHLVMEAIV
ncbi:hypothetical protein MANAM107_08560 [Actinomyces capricornis]|uniref:Uncharacterized protein n=1 Tax=Actinomyces capricornis TaxID=2755559 RepID=A0ABM7U9G0_9ACTO|nr:hypothetical protein MANAM107_08560 [Actinomyces capricornis]